MPPLPEKQQTVIVRVDVVIYAVILVVSILALASLITERVDVTIIGSLLTFAGGVFTGWLTYLRLCSGRKADDGEGEDTTPPGEGTGDA